MLQQTVLDPSEVDLARELEVFFAMKVHGPTSISMIDDKPAFDGGRHTESFQRAAELFCPEFTPDEIVDAAKGTLDYPTPADLCDDEALERTRAYFASAEQVAKARCEKEVAELHKMIGEDPNWVLKHGIVLLKRRVEPFLAYIFAVDLRLDSIDGGMLRKIERDAVEADKESPYDLYHLADQLFELLSMSTSEIVEQFEQAKKRIEASETDAGADEGADH